MWSADFVFDRTAEGEHLRRILQDVISQVLECQSGFRTHNPAAEPGLRVVPAFVFPNGNQSAASLRNMSRSSFSGSGPPLRSKL